MFKGLIGLIFTWVLSVNAFAIPSEKTVQGEPIKEKNNRFACLKIDFASTLPSFKLHL